MGWSVNTTPRPLYPRARSGTHCIGGCVGPMAGLDECGKSRPQPEFDPRTVQRYRLSCRGPQIKYVAVDNVIHTY